MRLNIIEVVEQLGKIIVKADRISFLHKHNTLALRDLLRAAFDETITFNIDVNEIEYKRDTVSKNTMSFSTLLKQASKLIYFVEGGKGGNMTSTRKEAMLRGILESLTAEEADFLIHVMSKDLKGKYKNLTKPLVRSTWPNLLQD